MFSNKRTLLSTVMASSVLVACGSDNKSNNNSNNQGNDDVNKDDSYTTVTIDASSREAYAYLDLDTAAVVSESDDWDIAFKRDGIIVNANKATAIADSQAEKYDGDDVIADAIVNATAETEEGDFLEVTTIEGEFVGSDVVPVITASDLYIYNGIIDPSDHGFSAQSDNYYYLTSGEGDSYAQMNVSSFEKSSPFAPYAFVANIDF